MVEAAGSASSRVGRPRARRGCRSRANATAGELLGFVEATGVMVNQTATARYIAPALRLRLGRPLEGELQAASIDDSQPPRRRASWAAAASRTANAASGSDGRQSEVSGLRLGGGLQRRQAAMGGADVDALRPSRVAACAKRRVREVDTRSVTATRPDAHGGIELFERAHSGLALRARRDELDLCVRRERGGQQREPSSTWQATGAGHRRYGRNSSADARLQPGELEREQRVATRNARSISRSSPRPGLTARWERITWNSAAVPSGGSGSELGRLRRPCVGCGPDERAAATTEIGASSSRRRRRARARSWSTRRATARRRRPTGPGAVPDDRPQQAANGGGHGEWVGLVGRVSSSNSAVRSGRSLRRGQRVVLRQTDRSDNRSVRPLNANRCSGSVGRARGP